MRLRIYLLIVVLGFFGIIDCGKLKLVAFKGPHGGFLGLKVRKPKFLGHGIGGFGGFGGHGFGGGGGYHHSSGYEHHESHHSYHSSGSFGNKFGWLGK